MEFKLTQDGSYTVYNQLYNEHYHSISGAFEEAQQKHVKALGIEDNMKILDFCFGLGYNSILALKNHNNIEIIGLENDINILEMIKNLKVPDEIKKEYDSFRNIANSRDICNKQNNRIKIILDDALKSIKILPNNYFDRIFFDPFSPKKQPKMWSESVFQNMYRIMKPKAKLSTYSCAKMVRRNMESAGLEVIDGPVIGRKSPATIAIKL
ncbi:MAG: hypothetical protein K8S23_06620 [Candidatus Cloacimonetes bacterium]|nr:hypothetical protein [Candidatus Cloacimonadota bacterium]